jgi:hypothetical protein
MTNTLTIGKRLVPVAHIAFVEPYEPGETPRIQTVRNFQARVVLLNRDSILIEETVEDFAAAHGFALMPIDRVAANRLVRFSVETFAPAEGFTPSKPYASRLKWRDLDGNDQSKLLLTDPETALALAVTGEADPNIAASSEPTAAGRRRVSVRRGDGRRTPAAKPA